MASWRVVEAGPASLESVGPLFREMVAHHRTVAGADWPVRDAEAAWERRRPQYERWLGEGDSWLLLLQRAEGAEPVGYAFLRVTGPGPTWELGDRVGELESLAVTAVARGQGLGSLLIAHARELLRARGVRYWAVGVVEANEGAVRLYEREGFRPFYRELLGEV